MRAGRAGGLGLARLEVLFIGQRFVLDHLDRIPRALLLVRRRLYNGEAAPAQLVAQRIYSLHIVYLDLKSVRVKVILGIAALGREEREPRARWAHTSASAFIRSSRTTSAS